MPASMFMYGSILIAVTLRPVVLSNKPVDEAFFSEMGQIVFTKGRQDYELACATRDWTAIQRTNDTFPNPTDHTA